MAIHHMRVIMPREVERWKKFCAGCGLVFVLLLIIGIAVALSGCAGKKPSPSHPMAQLVIPRECADSFEFTTSTKCETVETNVPKARCSNMLVHFTCAKSVPRK